MGHNQSEHKPPGRADRLLLAFSRTVVWLTWAVLLGVVVFVGYLIEQYYL